MNLPILPELPYHHVGRTVGAADGSAHINRRKPIVMYASQCRIGRPAAIVRQQMIFHVIGNRVLTHDDR